MPTFHPNVWYPFTIQKDAPQPLKVKKGDGLFLELEDGRRIMDCISSWWVNLYGHAHPKVAQAIAKQAETLEQVIFANFTHDLAEQVAENLAELLPGSLNKVFYSDDGSTSVEVALKMAIQYWQNRGEERSSFICFEEAYHGDTLGAMSVSGRSVFTEVFEEVLFEVDHVAYPETWRGDQEVQAKEEVVLQQIQQLLSQNPHKYAGIIIEPLIQGSGGMRMCREQFLQDLQALCKQYDTLLIFDEVMTGFGRTGSPFACLRAGVEPDIICLSKGLTGGFMPLSVTVCSEEIYEAFNTSDPHKTFWHGHSYTANPLGCAAAVASFELLKEHQPIFEEIEQWHAGYLDELAAFPAIKRIRVTGTIAAFDIKTDEEDGYLNRIGLEIKKRCVAEGLLLRPLGNTLYLMPPYCTTREQLGTMYNGIQHILADIGVL